jgi:hypothetical protein
MTILRSNLLHNVLGPQQERNNQDSLPAEDKHLTLGASQPLQEQRLQQMLLFSSKSMSIMKMAPTPTDMKQLMALSN